MGGMGGVVVASHLAQTKECRMLDELMKAIAVEQDVERGCYAFALSTIKFAATGCGQCYNPIAGSYFHRPGDALNREINISVPRLLALAYFGRGGPLGVPLPLNYREREVMKGKGIPELTLWALFSRSVEANSFNCNIHPSFHAYAKGLLLSERGHTLTANDPQLVWKYPPIKLPGLNLETTIWSSLSIKGSRI